MARVNTTRALILEYFASRNGHEIRIDEVMALGAARSATYTMLAKLAKEGEIVRVKPGLYRKAKKKEALKSQLTSSEIKALNETGSAIGKGKSGDDTVVKAYRKSRSADGRVQDALTALFPDGIKNVKPLALLQWIDVTRELLS